MLEPIRTEACLFFSISIMCVCLVKRTHLDTKKDRPCGTIYVQESAWVRLRQAAHHWTTVVTLQKMEKPGWRYPARRDTSRCVKDARYLKNDRTIVGSLDGKGKHFLCHNLQIQHNKVLRICIITLEHSVLSLANNLQDLPFQLTMKLIVIMPLSLIFLQ